MSLFLFGVTLDWDEVGGGLLVILGELKERCRRRSEDFSFG